MEKNNQLLVNKLFKNSKNLTKILKNCINFKTSSTILFNSINKKNYLKILQNV